MANDFGDARLLPIVFRFFEARDQGLQQNASSTQFTPLNQLQLGVRLPAANPWQRRIRPEACVFRNVGGQGSDWQ